MQYATLFNHSEGDSCEHSKCLSSTQNSLKITQDLALININSVGWLAAKWAACCLECDCPGLPPCNWFGLRNSRSCPAIFSFSHSEVSLSTKASTTSFGVRYDKCLLMLAVAASTITGWFGVTLAGRSKKKDQCEVLQCSDMHSRNTDHTGAQQIRLACGTLLQNYTCWPWSTKTPQSGKGRKW